VISTALQKRPADRYRSAAEMARALTPAAASDYAGDTAVFTTAPGPNRSRASGRGWWLAAAAVLVAGGVAVITLVRNGDDPPTSATSASTGAAATTVVNTPTTQAPTTVAPTTVAPTTIAVAADPPAPNSVEQLITVFADDPVRYGPRTGEVIDRLGEIDNRGRKSRERATELLDSAYAWADGGELTAEAIVLLEPVLSPLVGDDDDGDEDD
jgi:hypothetical protein